MTSRKKNQTSQKWRIQTSKKHQNQEQALFFKVGKAGKKLENHTGIDIKGKRIPSNIRNQQKSHKLISQIKVQGVKKGSTLSNNKNPHVPILNNLFKNSHTNNQQNTTKRNTQLKNMQKLPINIGISTQRGNYFLYHHLVAVIRKSHNNNEFCHMNEQILTERRQAYLNSKFHQRVNRLTSITTQNQIIYHRINSQKSHYLKDQMAKSYESNMEISRRLSMSRVSQKSGKSSKSSANGKSRCSIISNYSSKSMKSKKSSKIAVLKAKNTQKQPLMKIQSNNVNELKNHQLQHFAVLFDHKKQPNNIRISSRMSTRHIKSTSSKENRYQISEVSKTVELKKPPRYNEDQKLPKVCQNYQTFSISQQHEEKTLYKSGIKNKILSAIDENVLNQKQTWNKTQFLHKIIEEPLKSQKMTFAFGSVRR